MKHTLLILLCLSAPPPVANAVAIIAPTDDVMTSSFFQGGNTVRGYAGDNRPTLRVSTDGAFGLSGAETIYLAFNASDFASLDVPVANALLTVQSVDGGFGANAGPGSPFTVSAHGVTSDPLVDITDDTNPSGPVGWLDFYNSNLLAADPAAHTVVESFGPVTFDVTALVNDWIEGVNSVFTIALTGMDDASGADFLHGFLNNSEAPGSTYLTVTPVPEPTSLAIGVICCVALVGWVTPPRGRRSLRNSFKPKA